MSFITNTNLVLIDARSGLKFEAFPTYQELVAECLLRLDDWEFKEIVKNSINPHLKPTETFKFSGKPKNQISADFLRRFQSAGCQCGRQKLENSRSAACASRVCRPI